MEVCVLFIFPVFMCVFFCCGKGSPGGRVEADDLFVFGQHINQSRNRRWGKEGEGGEWLAGEGGGVGDIGGTSGVHVGKYQGVGEGSPYAILRYICHRGAYGVRQMGSGILDNGSRLMGGGRS